MDRVAVITGGTGALGTALAQRFAHRGHGLAVTYVVPEEGTAFEETLGLDEDRLFLRRVDSTDSEALVSFVDDAAVHFGGVHILGSLVGGWAGGRDAEETDDVRFDRMLDLNLRSAFYSIRATLPHIRKSGWGRIVVVGSRAAFEAPPGQAAYNVAKAGVITLAQSVAHELRETEITANAVVPAVIDTPAAREAMPFSDYLDWPDPDEIAAVIDWLCTEESQVMNGAVVPVYGKA